TEINPKDPKKYGVWFGMHIPLVSGKGVVLVEGELDCMLLKQTGLVSNVWAVMGTGITKEQIATLAAVNHPLIFFFDNDKAGHELFTLLHKKLNGLTPHYFIKNYFGCKDAGQAVEENKIRPILQTLTKCS
ncbi:MAG: toprim domain-containing protein, partial [Thermodesulfovibrionales bacterium]